MYIKTGDSLDSRNSRESLYVKQTILKCVLSIVCFTIFDFKI